MAGDVGMTGVAIDSTYEMRTLFPECRKICFGSGTDD